VELEIAQTDVLRGRESGSEIVIRDPRQPLGRMDASRSASDAEDGLSEGVGDLQCRPTSGRGINLGIT